MRHGRVLHWDGYLLAKAILCFFGRALNTSLSLLFPPWRPLLTLLGVIVVAPLTLRPPLRRAVERAPRGRSQIRVDPVLQYATTRPTMERNET